MGYSAFLTPGSQPHIFENLLTILVKKFYNSLKIGPNSFLQHFKIKINLNFVKFVATKRYDNKFFYSSLLLLFLDRGSGMGKNQDPGSGINILYPQSWYKLSR